MMLLTEFTVTVRTTVTRESKLQEMSDAIEGRIQDAIKDLIENLTNDANDIDVSFS